MKPSKNPKSEKYIVVPSEEGRTYGIDLLNLGEPANDSESESESENESKPTDESGIESKLIPVQNREGHMAIKKYWNKSTKHECNVLFNF